MAQAASKHVPICNWIASRSGAGLVIRGQQFISNSWLPVRLSAKAIECTEGGVMAQSDEGDIFLLAPTRMAPKPAALTKSQRFVLEWLSKEDSSAWGECKGLDLDALIAADLAAIVKQSADPDHSRVALTERGWDVLADLQAEAKAQAEAQAQAQAQGSAARWEPILFGKNGANRWRLHRWVDKGDGGPLIEEFNARPDGSPRRFATSRIAEAFAKTLNGDA